MTPASAAPLDALRRARHTLGVVLLVRALLGGAAVALVIVAIARVLSFAGNTAVLSWMAVLAVAAGVCVAFAVRVRDGRLTDRRVALWAEERTPGVDFALVTAADPRHVALVPALAPALARVPWPALVRGATRRALVPFAVACAVALVAALVAPVAASRAAGLTGVPGATRGPATTDARDARSALAELRAIVRSPAYAGGRAETFDEPTSVPGLVGSVVELRGEGETPVTAAVGGDTLVARADDGWVVRLAMPARPAVVRLASGPYARIVALEPRPDSIPAVTLLPGASDTVVRTPTGSIPFGARAHDDVGLTSGAFEYIVSSGEGETFEFRSGTLGARTFGGARDGELRATLDLTTLALKPGDVVHVRAVARDGNTLSGPGVGTSETRAVRVARIGEGDSVAVEGAPPPDADTAAISQRMLLVLTERLNERRPRLSRDTVLAESRRISVDQTRLRKRVGELVYMRLGEAVDGEHSHFAGDGHDHGQEGPLNAEQLLARASAATGGGTEPGVTDFHGDETPVIAVNKPLLEAYNHMWDASRALDVGEPQNAIPPMRLAIAALQRARAAERIYLRGRPPTVVVDIARVRLQGEDRGSGSTRDPRAPLDAGERERLRRLDAMLARLTGTVGGDAADAAARAAASLIDSLLVLRVDALGANDALARALDDAVRRLQGGDDATEALLRARRAAAGAPVTSPTLPRWGAGW